MAQKRQRIGAAVAAGFFLVASLATSIAVIYTLVTQKNNDPAKPTTNTSTPSADDQKAAAAKAALVGTKLTGFTPSSDPVTTLQVTDTKVGDGAEAKSDSTLSVLYTGALVKDGTIFDTSADTPISLSLAQVIKGWQQGVPGMKVGGTRRLVIPAAEAYGDQSPSATIPANSDLVFDITLVGVK